MKTALAPDLGNPIYLGFLPFLAVDFVPVALLVAFPALAFRLPAALRM